MKNYEYDYEYDYDNQDYIDGEEKKPKFLKFLGILILIIILLIIIVSCVKKDNKSSNTNLSYIRVSNAILSPMFNNATTDYKINTLEDEIVISCSTESTKAKVEGCNNKIKIEKENQEHLVRVTAENGNVKTYKILINKTKEDQEEFSVQIVSNVENGKEVNSNVELNTQVVTDSEQIIYEWYKDDKKINNDNNKFVATESGEYYVKIIDAKTKQEAISNTFVVNIKAKNETSNNNDKINSSKNNFNLSITKISGNSDKWTESVTLYVEASTSNGLHSKAYSFDGGKTYQASNSKKFTTNQMVKIVVRDIKGNVVSKNVNITKIDTTIPKVAISATNKTNKSVILKAIVTPTTTASGYKYEWYKDGDKIVGATSSTFTATQSGTYKVKVTTGVNKRSISSDYKFETINISCPMISATTTKGVNIPPKTWFNEVIYIKITPSSEIKNYDVYLNQYGVFDEISKDFTYFDTLTTTTKIKIVNNGLRVLKIVVRDKYGNSETCYSNVYYLK